MSTRTPKTYSAYRVTASDVEGMPEGQVLIDKGVLLTRVWDVFNFETGEHTSAVGQRIGRVCATCRTEHKRAANLGHPGPCGPESPRFVGRDSRGVSADAE